MLRLLVRLPRAFPRVSRPVVPACRWWTRGWTLQELLAPRNLHFYDCVWNNHGGKRLRSLEISEITGIDLAVLENSDLMKSMPVGRKMSWVARRTTTREEDIAYCLLGVFDINMSLIYGEGQKAFIRFQEEILRKTNDLTLFAWTAQDQSEPGYKGMNDEGWWGFRGILASSPVEFKDCREVARDHHIDLNRDFTLTNTGLRIWTHLSKGSEDDYILNVGSFLTGESLETRKIGIYLQKTPPGFYGRLPGRLFLAQDDNVRTRQSVGPSTIYIRKEVTSQEARRRGTSRIHQAHPRPPRASPAHLHQSQALQHLGPPPLRLPLPDRPRLPRRLPHPPRQHRNQHPRLLLPRLQHRVPHARAR